MSANDLQICCQVPNQFGTLEIRKFMGCDRLIPTGVYACDISSAPCDTPFEACPDDGGICVPTFITDCGKSTFESTYIPSPAELPFTRCGSGSVDLSFSVNVIGCTDAIDGCPDENAIAGDYIKAYIAVSVNCGSSTIYYPVYTPSGSMTPDTPVAPYDQAASAQDDALTGLSCDFSISIPFDAEGWDGHCCQAQISYTAWVKVFHAGGSPAAFNIQHPSGPTTHAIVLTASVSGACCSHPLTITDVDV